jgi:hypothetical protein
MNSCLVFAFALLTTAFGFSQDVSKPVGCFRGHGRTCVPRVENAHYARSADDPATHHHPVQPSGARRASDLRPITYFSSRQREGSQI